MGAKVKMKKSKPEQIKHENLLTTDQVAQHFKVPVRYVLRMIRLKRLKAKKLGWIWLINRADLPDKWPPPLPPKS